MAKFTGLVALFAIFVDAAVGHGILWENDPYWTYWITKTALIATVFGLGTAWIGIGVGRGAAITAVHTVVLTVYYWSLSPIGLPSHPEWLDLEHTWGTGVPVHFGVIYLGYLGSLWLWRRRELTRRENEADDRSEIAREAVKALGASVAIVLLAGGLSSLAVGEFPGATWFLVRLLITVPFLLGWWAVAGRDREAAVAGAIVLAFVWATYGHFLGPSGLPDPSLRIIGQDPPSANVEWMTYRDLWLVSLPIYAAVSVAVLLVLARPYDARRGRIPGFVVLAGGLAALLFLLSAGTALVILDPNGDEASIEASGSARVEQGEWYSDDFTPAPAQLELIALERNPRVTPLPPHDRLDIDARITHPTGTTYEVKVDRPMVDDPLGRHGTWWGVGLHRWHHGRSGIGTDKLPPIHSEVAAFGVGRISADGRTVATGVPVHVMTAEKGIPGRLEMDVGDDQIPVPGLPDGHLRVVWDDYEGGSSQTPVRIRNTVGSATLLGLLAVAFIAVRREESLAGI